VLAPDLFWRTEPGLTFGHDEMESAFAVVHKLDIGVVVQDASAALAALRRLPEVTSAGGRAGALGFCLGGTLAWLLAVNGDPDTAVCYYGSLIAGALEGADAIDCPVLLIFGDEDPYIPHEDIDAVAAMAAEHEAMECYVQEGAGHAFDNSFAPQFANPPAAAAAWKVTAAFLARTLPVD